MQQLVGWKRQLNPRASNDLEYAISTETRANADAPLLCAGRCCARVSDPAPDLTEGLPVRVLYWPGRFL